MLKYNVLDICVHQLYGVPVYVKRITVKSSKKELLCLVYV